VDDEQNKRRRTYLTFLLSLATNFVWEMAQMGGFSDLSGSVAEMFTWCGIATVCDAVFITVLYLAGAGIARDANWTSRLSWRRLVVVTGVPAIAAVVVERIALQTGLWRYSSSMPVVPWLGVGLWPFLQLPVLTLLIFTAVGRTRH
jgi:hypothetical protein